jgi:glycosyltransferase involved in cell wall biosynthesis
MRGSGAAFTYGVRGSRLSELKTAITPEDTNIRFVDFAPPEKLEARLSAPDVHIVTLREAYTGAVVPSKFFGALAAGRPVLFEGSEKCSIAQWITEYKVGWHLRSDNIDRVAADLEAFGKDEARRQAMFKHCHEIYHAHFSKKTILDKWDKELKSLIADRG